MPGNSRQAGGVGRPFADVPSRGKHRILPFSQWTGGSLTGRGRGACMCLCPISTMR